MKRMLIHKVIVVVLIILVFLTTSAFGQEKRFPVKAINLYLGYSPGGGAGNSGTILAEGLKKYLNQPVIVNFKPGATQAIAAEFVKNSTPDGYTLFYVAHPELIAKIAQEGPMPKFGLEGLDSLGSSPYTPNTITVNAESPFKNVEDFIAAAKKSPGSLNYGSSGKGSVAHLIGELFSQKARIVMNHIPFAGTGPAITALLGKHIDVGFMSAGAFGAHIKPGGGLRTLIVFERKRDSGLADVPTAMERGYDIFSSIWFGLQAPKGLPKTVRDTLVQAIEKTVKDAEVISRLAKLGFNTTYLSPEEADRKIQEEYKLFLNIWEEVGKSKL